MRTFSAKQFEIVAQELKLQTVKRRNKLLDLQSSSRVDMHYLTKLYRECTLKFKRSKASVRNQLSIEKQTEATQQLINYCKKSTRHLCT